MARWAPLRNILAATALAAFAAVSALAYAGGPKHAKHARVTIQQLEEQWRQAQLAGDVAAMDKLLSDDFMGVTASGQMNTKAQQLERVRNRTRVISAIELSDVKVKMRGQVAIVTSRAEITGTDEGRPITGSYRYIRVYERPAGGNWRITSFEATHIPAAPASRNVSATPRN